MASDLDGVTFSERMQDARDRPQRRPARLQRRRYSAANLEAYWRGREDEARLREEVDGQAPEFEIEPAVLEFPPPQLAPHDFATCHTPGHRSCAARRAWVTMRAKRGGP